MKIQYMNANTVDVIEIIKVFSTKYYCKHICIINRHLTILFIYV
jgi:hypothetical protein